MMERLYLDDFYVGQRFMSGSHTVDEDQITRFAREFDPQPFHLDEDAAKGTLFAGLAASGWHTAAITMRLFVKTLNFAEGAIGLGVDELRWLRPVRPGDRLRVRVTVIEVRRSQSKPDRGAVTLRQEVINQAGDVVMTMRGRSLQRCRTRL